MKKQLCESLLISKLYEINDIYNKYNPEGNYLTLAIVNGSFIINNDHYDRDKNNPIDIYVGGGE